MTAEWYYRTSNGRAEGPVTAAHLKQLAQLGEIGLETEIKKGAEGRWITANKVKGLLDAAPPKPTATKTTLPSWMQPQDGDDEAEPARPRPKSPAPLVRRPPVDADQDEDDRPVPVRRTAPSDVVDAEYTVTSPAKQRSPLLLVGAGVGGTLLVVGVIVAMVGFGGSNKATTDRTSDRTEPVVAGDKQRRDVPANNYQPPPVQEPNKSFTEAKKVLLDNFSEIGGTPEVNVRKGIDLLTKHLAQPNPSDREEAALLLEHAQVAVSDEKAVALLEQLESYKRDDLAARKTGNEAYVLVKRQQLEAVSKGLSRRIMGEWLNTDPKPDNTLSIQGRSSLASQYCNSLELALYDTLQKNAAKVSQQIADRKTKARKDKEQQAVLQNGTEEFKRIVEYPEKYLYGHYCFDGVFGSRLGNMKRDKDAKCYTVAFRCQQKQIFPAAFGLQKDEINFVVTDDMGSKLLDLRDSDFYARIYCRIRYANPDYNTFPMAFIYKVEFYEDPPPFRGQPKIVVE